MNDTRFNELLVKEASKTLTPLQAEELSLLRQLQSNAALQYAAQAQADAVTAVEEEKEEESETVVETEPEVEVEPEPVQTPTVIEGEIVEDIPAPKKGEITEEAAATDTLGVAALN